MIQMPMPCKPPVIAAESLCWLVVHPAERSGLCVLIDAGSQCRRYMQNEQHAERWCLSAGPSGHRSDMNPSPPDCSETAQVFERGCCKAGLVEPLWLLPLPLPPNPHPFSVLACSPISRWAVGLFEYIRRALPRSVPSAASLPGPPLPLAARCVPREGRLRFCLESSSLRCVDPFLML